MCNRPGPSTPVPLSQTTTLLRSAPAPAAAAMPPAAGAAQPGAEDLRRLRVTSCAAPMPSCCAALCLSCQQAGQAKFVHGRAAVAALAVGCADLQWPGRCVILYQSDVFSGVHSSFVFCDLPQNLTSENLHAALPVFSDLSVHVLGSRAFTEGFDPLIRLCFRV